MQTPSLIFYKGCPKCLVYPSAWESSMGYVGSLTYNDSKVNREGMAGRNKAPNPNNSKHTWHHRGVIMKGKESEINKRQYKGSGYFLFTYFSSSFS